MGSPFFFRWNLAALPKSSASGVLALVSLVWKDEFHELDFFNIIQFVRNSSGLIFFRISKSPSSQISNTPTNSNLYLNTVDFLRVKLCNFNDAIDVHTQKCFHTNSQLYNLDPF